MSCVTLGNVFSRPVAMEVILTILHRPERVARVAGPGAYGTRPLMSLPGRIAMRFTPFAAYGQRSLLPWVEASMAGVAYVPAAPTTNPLGKRPSAPRMTKQKLATSSMTNRTAAMRPREDSCERDMSTSPITWRPESSGLGRYRCFSKKSPVIRFRCKLDRPTAKPPN